MGFWSSLGGLVTGALTGGGGAAGVLGTALEVGGSIVGAKLASDANDKAAEQFAVSQAAAAQAQADANAQAQTRYDALQAQTAGGVSRLQGVVSNPNTLTPEQRAQLDELRRNSANQLATSSLRGSGRAITEAIKRVEADFTTRALGDNARRADTAAGQLANASFNATGRQANLDSSSGFARGNAVQATGLADAGATVANEQLRGAALGDVTSLIATNAKGRESRYSDRMATLEKRLFGEDERARI